MRLALPATGLLTLEVEITVRFAREVRPAEEVFDPSMIDSVFVAIEVFRSRFIDRKAAGHLSFISDNAGLHAFVLGDSLARSLNDATLAQPASPRHDGALVADALHGEQRTEVAIALSHFWTHVAERRLVMPPGSVITTGTQTAPFDTLKAGLYVGSIAGATVQLALIE